MVREKLNQRFLYFCGIFAPLLFIFVAVLGGALRPGYSHISDTVSELFSPGSPNKPLLDILHAAFALLMVLFGIGIFRLVRASPQTSLMGVIGALLYIVMGILSVTTATIFPQDAWGTGPTFAGQMHIIVSGVLSIIAMISILLLGTWFTRAGIFPGLRDYSFLTIIAVIIATAFFVANQGSPVMGLFERILSLIGLQWTFVLAFLLFSKSEVA